MKKPVISVITPSFNGFKYLKTCLDAVFASNFSNYEVIVIDDHSTDGSRQYLRNYQFFPTQGRDNFQTNIKFKTIFNNRNLGAAKSRNLGAKIAGGKYLLFLDVDTKIAPDCLQQITTKFQSMPNLGGLQAKLDTGGHFLSIFGFPYEIPADNQEKLIFGARSAGMAIRKDLFERIGGFDDDYLIYGEDTDLSWRVWLAGYQILYFPQAKVHHFQKSSLTRRNLFYEGAKNSLQNILKNAPLTIMIWMVPLHIFGWLMVSFKLILQGRLSSVVWLYKGLAWNIVHIRKIFEKRKHVQQIKAKTKQPPLFGRIKLKHLLIKGLNWVKNV